MDEFLNNNKKKKSQRMNNVLIKLRQLLLKCSSFTLINFGTNKLILVKYPTSRTVCLRLDISTNDYSIKF